MWLFFLGLAVGCLLMSWVFADGAYEAEQDLEFQKRQYGYSYSDILEAHRHGCDGKPPVPPRPQ
jgi:hypothetical protein